jgi:hypothetical protein
MNKESGDQRLGHKPLAIDHRQLTLGNSLRLLPLLVVLALLLVPAIASGQQPATAVAQADYEFGQVMRFSLTAESETPFRRATLFLRAPDLPNTFTTDVSFEAGPAINLTYDLSMAQIRLAPFTTVTYWWEIEDANGNRFATPEQAIEYADDQFEWRQAGQGIFTVYWTGEDSGLGQTALDIATDALPRLNAIMPLEWQSPVRIYIYPSAADLRTAMRLTGREWVGAHAQPELGVVLVTAVNARTAAADLGQSIPHELSHLFIYKATGVGYEELPAWFDEGLATLFEQEPNPNYEAVLAEAVAAGQTLPFTDLCNAFPAAPDQAVLAYAQSASLVRQIQADYGNRVLNDLVAAYADGADCHSGVRRVLGVSLVELNQEWLNRQQPPTPADRFWRENALWLALLAAGFAFMGLHLLNPTIEE